VLDHRAFAYPGKEGELLEAVGQGPAERVRDLRDGAFGGDVRRASPRAQRLRGSGPLLLGFQEQGISIVAATSSFMARLRPPVAKLCRIRARLWRDNPAEWCVSTKGMGVEPSKSRTRFDLLSRADEGV
jgi:hypothetical protein